MSPSERQARRYLDEHALGAIAASLVAVFADEAPGVDVGDPVHRDTHIPWELAARAIAALSEALRVQVANTAAAGAQSIATAAEEHAILLSAHGICMRAAAVRQSSTVAVAGVWLRRGVHLIEAAASLLDASGRLTAAPGVEPADLAAQFRVDARRSRAAADRVPHATHRQSLHLVDTADAKRD